MGYRQLIALLFVKFASAKHEYSRTLWFSELNNLTKISIPSINIIIFYYLFLCFQKVLTLTNRNFLLNLGKSCSLPLLLKRTTTLLLFHRYRLAKEILAVFQHFVRVKFCDFPLNLF